MQPILPSLPATPATSLTLTSSIPDLRAWKVGQVLQAQALSNTVNNQVTLRIGPATIEAQTQTPIAAGQKLTVQVVRLGEQPILKLLPPAPAAADPVATALRSALPRQTGLPPLLANLGLLAQAVSSNTAATPLPAPVLQAAAQIYRDLTDSRQVATARGLQQAIRDSGLFMESKLTQSVRGGPNDLGADFKAALLRLQSLLNETRPATVTPATAKTYTTTPGSTAAGGQTVTLPRTESTAMPGTLPAPPLRGTPPVAQAPVTPSLAGVPLAANALDELQRQIEGTLSRIQLNQLASLPESAEAPPSWLLELPVRHKEQVDLFHLRIGQEAHSKADNQMEGRPWIVTLAFDLPGLGPVHARVAVLAEQVSTTFWAEQASTTEAFHTHIETLREKLQQAGLGVGDLICHTGQPPYPPSAAHPPIMDTRA